MTDKETIEAALSKCGMRGKAAAEFARAISDCMHYWPDIIERGYGEVRLMVFKGEYERGKGLDSWPKPPRD